MRISICLFTFLIFFAACKKEDPGPLHYFVLPTDTDCAPVALDSFPLAIGHRWIYDTGDTMSTLGDTIVNQIKTTKLRIGRAFNYVDYYVNNANNGFWDVATRYDPTIARANTAAIAYLYDMLSSNDSQRTSSLWLAKYPVVLNDTFSSGENYPGDVFHSQWVAFKRVTTAAGTFDCAVLRIQGRGPQSWYRYYSAKGLIREIWVVTYGSKVKEDPGFTYAITDLININF